MSLLPLTSLEQALLTVDRVGAGRAMDLLLGDAPPERVLDDVIAHTLDRIGDRWEAGECSLAQVYMAARIVEELAARLFPPPSEGKPTHAPPVGLAVLADHHVLGKRLVLAHLRAARIPVVDLGQGLTPEVLAEKVAVAKLDVVLVSMLMLRAVKQVPLLVAGLRARGSTAKVIVGGAPFRLDTDLWRSVGADAGAIKASEAPGLVAELRRRG